MIIFRYKPEVYGTKNEIIWRPVADIYLQSQKGSWFELHPYIDSGADVTMIPLSFGKLLGLTINRKEIGQIGGIRGSVPIIYFNIPVKIGDKQIMTKIAWALIEDIPPLLGRTNVFDYFIVTFKQAEKTIEFKERVSSGEGEII